MVLLKTEHVRHDENLAIQYRISFAFSSKIFCRSQPSLPCILMNPNQNILRLLKHINDREFGEASSVRKHTLTYSSENAIVYPNW